MKLAAKMELKHNEPRRIRWTNEAVDAYINKAIEIGERPWAVAVAILYDTGQRPAQVFKATWTDSDGEGLSFAAVKRGRAIPRRRSPCRPSPASVDGR